MSQLQTLENLHWKQLKKMVEEAGGTWTNVEEGIAFLNELKAAADTKQDSTDADNPDTDAETDQDTDTSKDAGGPVDPAAQSQEDVHDSPESGAEEAFDEAVAPVLDREDNYSKVAGISNACFYQNGHYFGGDGNYIAPEDVT